MCCATRCTDAHARTHATTITVCNACRYCGWQRFSAISQVLARTINIVAHLYARQRQERAERAGSARAAKSGRKHEPKMVGLSNCVHRTEQCARDAGGVVQQTIIKRAGGERHGFAGATCRWNAVNAQTDAKAESWCAAFKAVKID